MNNQVSSLINCLQPPSPNIEQKWSAWAGNWIGIYKGMEPNSSGDFYSAYKVREVGAAVSKIIDDKDKEIERMNKYIALLEKNQK